MLARWLHFSEKEIQRITLGGLLHDVGKLYFDDFLLTKPGRLTVEEYEEIQQHAFLGYKLLKEHTVYGEEICLMALEQHEREDGTGYPNEKKPRTFTDFRK
jgi:HD-GYP domain-containing protein (c-di-GMP phosphodiesterase class II)